MSRLLIMDDESEAAVTMGLVASRMGFEVATVASCRRFYAQVEQWAPTHILLDLLLPEQDGIEILRALAGRGCAARIIVTSRLDRRTLDAARRAGCERGLNVAGVLPKPVAPSALRNLLSATCCPPVPARSRAARPAGLDEALLRAALEQGHLRMVYQPKVSIEGVVVGFEALMRWRDPVRGEIGPAQFIKLAENGPLIHGISSFALRTAGQWFIDRPPDADVTIAINLSVRDIEEIELVERLATQCEVMGIAASQVVLEVTETGAMRRRADALDVLTRLRMKGFRLSIDDFGTGHSSMRQLALMPFSEIKIDREFIGRMLASSDLAAIVRMVVKLARNLEMDVVAEGVEDRRTFEAVREVGCNLVQGYFISRPLEAQPAYALLKRGRGFDV